MHAFSSLRQRFLVAVLLLGCAACSTSGGHLIVAGRALPCRSRVITFEDRQGFNAHSERCAFSDAILPHTQDEDLRVAQRFGTRSTEGMSAALTTSVAHHGWDLPELQERIDQFVLHYDACHDSTQCFEVLHDQRGLSVHFLLDLDGTLYQTLDLAARARHATRANDRSVGIEIAQLGARASAEELAKAYVADDQGRDWLRLPRRTTGRGFLRTGAWVMPARTGLFHGEINGRALVQHDFTAAQYQTLRTLLTDLHEIFPRIRLAPPRDAEGRLIPRCLSAGEFAAFQGVLGHFHVQAGKSDPGVAFDWQRLGLMP